MQHTSPHGLGPRLEQHLLDPPQPGSQDDGSTWQQASGRGSHQPALPQPQLLPTLLAQPPQRLSQTLPAALVPRLLHLAQGDGHALPHQDAEPLLCHEREEPPLDRLSGSLDATKLHTDERRDASDQGWRDLKIGAWFEATAQPPATPDGDWDVQAEKITYFCDIAEAQTFGDLLRATGIQRRAPRAKEHIFASRIGAAKPRTV